MTARSFSFGVGFCRKVLAPALMARSLLPTRSRPDNTITGMEDSFSCREAQVQNHQVRHVLACLSDTGHSVPGKNNVIVVCVEPQLKA
jgi:hypothetical protein